MSENRPQAPAIQDNLDAVAKLYPAAVARVTGQASTSALGDFTTGGTHGDLSDVINLALSRILDEIDSDVRSYARMLDDAGRTGATGATVPTLVKWLRVHIGFFTINDDPRVAWEFESDVARWRSTLEAATDPGGHVSIDTGERCQEGCDGTYRVSVDREKPVPYDLAFEALRGKDARCSENGKHVIRAEMLPMVRRWVARQT